MKYNKILICTPDIWSVPSPLKPKGQAFLRNSFHEVTKMSLIEIIFPENFQEVLNCDGIEQIPSKWFLLYYLWYWMPFIHSSSWKLFWILVQLLR